MTEQPKNRAERALALLDARYPGWVPAVEFERPCGRQAWRTAISEARAIVRERGDDIENDTHRVNDGIGTWILSRYRLVRGTPEPKPHDLNSMQPSGGRLW